MIGRAWSIDAAFIAEFRPEFRAPAPGSELAEVEAAMRCALPAEVRGWYEAADGGVARAVGSELTLHSLEEVKRWFAHSPLAKRGQFPFASNNDSDPFCVCCKGPLLGHVIQTPHDDEPRLMYRSAAGFFRAAAAQLATAKRYEPHDLPSEFDAPERTDEDARIAHALVAQVTGKELKGMSATITLMFAADLLSDADAIRAIAEQGDQYVREHAGRRLARLGV